MTSSAVILLVLKRVDCNDGVASYLESLITGLRENGDRVVIVSGPVTTLYGSQSRQAAIRSAAVEWLVLDDFRPSRLQPKILKEISSLIRKHNVDVISPQGFGVLPISYLVGRISGRPIVTNYHPSIHGSEVSAVTGELSMRQRTAYRVLPTMFRSDRYIALSSEIETFFQTVCAIPKRRIHKQMLGVETEFFRTPTAAERRAARSRFGLDEASLVAVLPGRMNVNKGHDVVAAAFRALRSRRTEIEFICLFPGGGDQRDRIEENALRESADHKTFRFLGFVDREALRDTYWAADIVLLPSRVEGFGLVVAEAMCCGAIAIRTPSGGWQDQIIEGETGYVVPFNDPGALEVAVERVLDDPARDRMRENAMHHAASAFDISLMIDGTSRLYREMAEKRRGRQLGALTSRSRRDTR